MSENVPGDSPAASAFGDVQAECRRVQPVIHVARTIGELGGDPQRVLAEAGIPAGLFANPDNSIPLQALGDLLERCVAVTRCQHFGLRLGADAGGNPLGLLGDVMERCVDVGTAIAHFHQYFHLLDRSALLTRTVAGASASIVYALTESTGPGADQISDAAAAIGMGLLRRLCGAQWKPQAVLLPRQRPRDVRPYEEVFACTPQFAAERVAPGERTNSSLPGAVDRNRGWRRNASSHAGILPARTRTTLMSRSERSSPWVPQTIIHGGSPPPSSSAPGWAAPALAELSADELAKIAQNPVGALISVPFQNNTNFNHRPGKGTRNVLNIQPVIPVSVNDDWNVITRTILPVISQPALYPDDERANGIGDLQFSAMLSPAGPGA